MNEKWGHYAAPRAGMKMEATLQREERFRRSGGDRQSMRLHRTDVVFWAISRLRLVSHFPSLIIVRSFCLGDKVSWSSLRGRGSESSPVILVEGVLDLAVLWQAGFRNTTCALSTHLTPLQFHQLLEILNHSFGRAPFAEVVLRIPRRACTASGSRR